MRDPRTLWVSPDGEWAVADCADIPHFVMRCPNHSKVSQAALSRSPPHIPNVNPSPATRARGYFAKCRRFDLPWERRPGILVHGAGGYSTDEIACGPVRPKEFPHTCPFCGAPSYQGIVPGSTVHCSLACAGSLRGGK